MYRIDDPFEYAWHYVIIYPDKTYKFRNDPPEELKERFAREWAADRKRIEEMHKNGDFSEF